MQSFTFHIMLRFVTESRLQASHLSNVQPTYNSTVVLIGQMHSRTVVLLFSTNVRFSSDAFSTSRCCNFNASEFCVVRFVVTWQCEPLMPPILGGYARDSLADWEG